MTEASHSSLPAADEQRMPTSKGVSDLADRRLNAASEEYGHHQVKNRDSQVSGKSTPKCCVIAQVSIVVSRSLAGSLPTNCQWLPHDAATTLGNIGGE